MPSKSGASSVEDVMFGAQMFRRLLLVVAPLHLLVILHDLWIHRSPSPFVLWEGLMLLVVLGLLICWRYVRCMGCTGPRILMLTCGVRWVASWLLAAPETIYTSTIIVLLYTPPLMVLCIMAGCDWKNYRIMGTALGLVAIMGSQRDVLNGTLLAEWRIGPAVTLAVILLATYINEWLKHYNQLQEAQRQAHKLELEVRSEKNQQLTQRMDAASRLAGTLAHEFNNLLTVILPRTSILCRRYADEDSEAIRQASLKAAKVTNDLLSLTRTHNLIPKTSDLTQIIEESRPALKRLSKGGPDLVINNCTEPLLVRCTRNELNQLLLSLVSNAVEASSPNQTIRVELSRKHLSSTDSLLAHLPQGPYTVLSVTDEGPGIPKDLLTSVFEPFYSTKEGHSGLGLTTAYYIAKNAGGDIRVTLRPEKGTAIEVYLPTVDKPPSEPCLQSPTVPRRNSGPGHILAVDDDSYVLQTLQKLLVINHYKVTAFSNPEEALAHLQQDHQLYDLIISDIRMPGMSGPQMISKLEASGINLPPYLFISGHVDDQTAGNYQIPADHLLLKPFQIEDLLNAVQRLIGERNPDTQPSESWDVKASENRPAYT